MPSILDLQDIYSEALVREVIEKTNSCGLTWTAINSTQFHTSEVDPKNNANVWDLYVTKTQIGTLSYKYTFDARLNSVSQITLTDGPLPTTSRDSEVKDLYEIVEIMVMKLDQKVKAALQFVQNVAGCNG